MHLLVVLSLCGAVALAWANGANDNGKGVATLVGGRILGGRAAMWIGHVATLCGAAVSIIVARRLIHAFQGAGLLPADAVGQAGVLAVVGLAAAAAVVLATWLRLPVSTTHALTGALVGTGVGMAAGVSWGGLLGKFVIPLLTSPLLAAAAAALTYQVLHRGRLWLGVTEETCVCVGQERAWVPVANVTSAGAGAAAGSAPFELGVHVGSGSECRQRYQGKVLGVSVASMLDAAHVFSAASISFARGMNDTPKLAALAVGVVAWSTAGPAVAMTALAMFAGGIVAARRVTRTMSEDIVEMNAGSAATANLVASAIVILASFLAMPVSTTHVTCGALFGIGCTGQKARWRTINRIVLAWVATLPLAAAIAAVLASFL